MISTITLLPRNNPNATEEALGQGGLPADPRQASLFAAGWTLGSLAELAGTHPVHSVTYYETVGARGTMRARGPARVFPVYHVFAGASEMTRVAERRFANPRTALQLAVLAGLNKKGQAILWLANLTSRPIEARVKTDRRFQNGLKKEMNERNAEEASCLPENWWHGSLPCSLGLGAPPLMLSPYALARLKLQP